MNENTPNGKYLVQRPIEVKCTDCGFVSKPKYQMEMNQENYTYSDGSITLCDNCMAIGWTDDPKKVYEAIKNDPLLSGLVERESPYYKK